MRRILIFLFLITALIVEAWSQVSFGVRAGVNLQNLNGEDNEGEKLNNELKFGFHGGVDVEIPIVPDFFLQPGILFSMKGANDVAEIEDLSATLSYIEVPVHFVYKPLLGAGRLIAGIGPYVAYGVSGKMEFEGDEEDIKFQNDVSLDDYNDNFFFLRPLDAGADIFFGYQFDMGFFAQLNAQLGLLNLEPKVDGESPEAITKNTGFGVSVGYRF
jgi:hypothetical protein